MQVNVRNILCYYNILGALLVMFALGATNLFAVCVLSIFNYFITFNCVDVIYYSLRNLIILV